MVGFMSKITKLDMCAPFLTLCQKPVFTKSTLSCEGRNSESIKAKTITQGLFFSSGRDLQNKNKSYFKIFYPRRDRAISKLSFFHFFPIGTDLPEPRTAVKHNIFKYGLLHNVIQHKIKSWMKGNNLKRFFRRDIAILVYVNF